MAKQRLKVEIIETGEKITLKHFKNNSTKLLVESSVTKKEIIDSRILSKAEFEIFIYKYKIPITIKNHSVYIQKDIFLRSLKDYKTWISKSRE